MPSSSICLFQNSAGQVLNDSAGFLRLIWSNQPRNLADTKALFTALAQVLRQLGYSRVLSNQAHMLPFTPDEQRWISQEWQPGAAKESGYRFCAILLADNVLARLAASFLTTATDNAFLRYRSFDDEAEAIAWLLRQQ